MLLKLDAANSKLKLVYDHQLSLIEHPDIVESIQKLTLDSSRPYLGLKGSCGLYGSLEWWGSIQNGTMPLEYAAGIISKIYSSIGDGVVGQGVSTEDIEVEFEFVNSDGSLGLESAYVNDVADYSLFRVGAKIEIVYALDELKMQPAENGGINYSRQVLEMAVSLE